MPVLDLTSLPRPATIAACNCNFPVALVVVSAAGASARAAVRRYQLVAGVKAFGACVYYRRHPAYALCPNALEPWRQRRRAALRHIVNVSNGAGLGRSALEH